MQSIDQAQIQQQAAAGRKIADILAQLIPSLSPSSGTTSNYGQTMRGRQVLVMVDGVALTGSRDVSRQLNSISPSSIEKIEVVSGASVFMVLERQAVLLILLLNRLQKMG